MYAAARNTHNSPILWKARRLTQMRRWYPAIVLLALWTAVLVVLLTPEVPDGHGFAHDRFQAVDQGGSGQERHENVLLAGWFLGAIVIALFVCLLAWAAQTPRDDSGLDRLRTWAFLLGGFLFEGVFTLMCLAYHKSLAHPADPAFLGPFPAGTSWMMFGIWLVPGFFIVLYVVFFNRWILPPDRLQRFEQRIRKTSES